MLFYLHESNCIHKQLYLQVARNKERHGHTTAAVWTLTRDDSEWFFYEYIGSRMLLFIFVFRRIITWTWREQSLEFQQILSLLQWWRGKASGMPSRAHCRHVQRCPRSPLTPIWARAILVRALSSWQVVPCWRMETEMDGFEWELGKLYFVINNHTLLEDTIFLANLRGLPQPHKVPSVEDFQITCHLSFHFYCVWWKNKSTQRIQYIQFIVRRRP